MRELLAIIVAAFLSQFQSRGLLTQIFFLGYQFLAGQPNFLRFFVPLLNNCFDSLDEDRELLVDVLLSQSIVMEFL
jgi:hypothetical protein